MKNIDRNYYVTLVYIKRRHLRCFVKLILHRQDTHHSVPDIILTFIKIEDL